MALPHALLRLIPATKRQRITAGVAVVVVAAAVGIGVGLSGGSTPPKKGGHPAIVPAKTASSNTICPLTDLPAPGGTVPQRPALLVKVGNEPEGARPQSGLNEADIVFDTPAEGFVMRYVAVYQCNNAASIGPIRSVRWVDYHMIARLFVQPILAFAGGIDPNVNSVESTPWIFAADLLTDQAAAAGTRITSRVAPDNLYTSTAALYNLYKGHKQPPPQIFDYSLAPPKGASPLASLGIDFSYETDVLWKWQPQAGTYLHTWSGVPDVDQDSNTDVTTTNIVVMIAHYVLGPYSESTGGTGDIESTLKGTGSGYVIRNGVEIPVTWHRQTFIGKITFTDAAGHEVDLAPGKTWVEIVPSTIASQITITH
jgi:hypothetical protein